MVKETIVKGFEMGLDIPDLSQIYIPRRRRGSGARKKEHPLSMSEVADILIQFSQSFPDTEPEKINKTHKRNRPPMTMTKKHKKKAKQSKYLSIPDMPVAMRDRIVEMGGYGIRLVIQKQLQDTDLNKNHGRLSLPRQKLLFDFATEEERKLLSKQENKNKKALLEI